MHVHAGGGHHIVHLLLILVPVCRLHHPPPPHPRVVDLVRTLRLAYLTRKACCANSHGAIIVSGQPHNSLVYATVHRSADSIISFGLWQLCLCHARCRIAIIGADYAVFSQGMPTQHMSCF